MKGDGHPTGPLDFRPLDFDRLWRGREKTTEVERRLVAESVARLDDRRILEVGPGGGRISSVLLAPEREYVGVDVTLEFAVRLRARWGRAGLWLAADLGRLPLASEAFTGAVLVRVYNFLTEPATALGELYRVLVPGGWLLVSYFSEPSIVTIWDEVRNSVRGPVRPGENASGPPPLPARAQFRRAVETAGFEWRGEYSVGLEDFRPLRWIPAALFVGLARALQGTGALPHHFVLLRKPGGSVPRLPPRTGLVVSTCCGAPLSGIDGDAFASLVCPGCGREVPVMDGVADLRLRPASGLDSGSPAIQVRAP